MRSLLKVGFGLSVLALGACSVINAPDEVTAQGTTTSTGTGGQGGQGGGTACTAAAECASLSDDCHQGVCNDGACVQANRQDGSPCDDGLACTEGDACQAGTCEGGTELQCTPMNECNTVGACDEAAGGCVQMPVPDGTVCDDADPCTATSACGAGVCVPGPSCQSTECTTSVCTPTGCENTFQPEGTVCGVTTCSTGLCDLEGKCTLTPVNTGGACDDGLFCTTGETCDSFGQCSNGGATCVKPSECIDVACDEDADTCDLVPILAGEPCEDGDVCTGGETCNNNLCTGGTTPTVYVLDDFSVNLGWSLGPEWGMGIATASSGGAYGGDPPTDHSPSADNRVAGVVIGGNATPALHAPYYAESPAFDATVAGGKLFVTYYRWLNSDYTPFMRNMVEVFDGTSWVEIWTSGSYPGVQDSPPVGGGWTFMSHEITAYKNAALKVRFGFEVTQDGVYTIGSWNLDDVKLQNTGCPF